MKEWGYLFFAWVYNICTFLFREKRYKIVLWNGHNRGLNGNLAEIYRKLKKQRPDAFFVILAKRDIFAGNKLWAAVTFFVRVPYHMATARKVFLNDNFLPLGYMKTEHTDTQFVQLWHGAGAFKRFGLSTEENESVARMVERANQKITHLFITSHHVRPFYQEAFAVDAEKIYATGIPVTDLYFDEVGKEKRRQDFLERYPGLQGKKLLLYTPTFRKTESENREILQHFDVRRVHEVLGEEWVILVKMHPKFPTENGLVYPYCYDMTDYPDISDLYLAADLLVTDYSSTVVEYVLLDKPIILYAYDLKEYDRGFYYDYETMMPGPVAHDCGELLQLLRGGQENREKRQRFLEFQYDFRQGGSAERILDILG